MDQNRAGRDPVTISRVAEAEIPADLLAQVQALLQLCFPGYPSRAYFKLPPHFRYLAMAGRLYTRNGWARAANRCSWLKIDNHTTLGLATAEDTGALMVKKIGPHDWPDGEVDLLGHLF